MNVTFRPMRTNVRRIISAVISGVAGACLLVPVSTRARADALLDLNNEFRASYNWAAERTLTNLRATVPLLVNRFGQIALYRPGVGVPLIFSMNMRVYLEARAIAHTAVPLYARLVPAGLGRLDADRLDWLRRYQDLLNAAGSEIDSRADLSNDSKVMQRGMLDDVRRAASRIYQRGEFDQAILDELGQTIRPAIRANLSMAAESQLTQFRTQIDRWKSEYPDLKWQEAVVVIIGVHQARGRYLQRQFFDWMLNDRPEWERQVVFAETMTPPGPLDTQPPIDSLVLLSKVLFDRGLSQSVFGDPLVLHSDVLGDAAEQIIGRW